MAIFTPNQQITQTTAQISVDVSPNNPLPVGSNKFQLVVVDDEGNVSEPMILEVIVQALNVPTAVLEIVDANGASLPPTVLAGRSFLLSGLKSTDTPPGKLVEYRFTLLHQ